MIFILLLISFCVGTIYGIYGCTYVDNKYHEYPANKRPSDEQIGFEIIAWPYFKLIDHIKRVN